MNLNKIHIKSLALFLLLISFVAFQNCRVAAPGSPSPAPYTGAPTEQNAARENASQLDGAYIWSGDIRLKNPEYVKTLFDDLKAIGIDTVILATTKHWEDRTCQKIVWDKAADFPNNLVTIVNQAYSHNMKIYIGLTQGWMPEAQCLIPDNYSLIVRENISTINDLIDTFTNDGNFDLKNGPISALAGWYLPDEPNISIQDLIPTILTDYYREIVKGIRTVPQLGTLPVVISPFLSYGDSPKEGDDPSPSEMARRALQFKTETGIDIQAWQDSAGSSATNLGWERTNPPYKYQVKDYYAAISKAIGAESTWAVSELFNYNNPLYGGNGYHAAALARLTHQLAAAKMPAVSKRLSWIPQVHMLPSHLEGFAPSKSFYYAYKAFFNYGGTLLKPANYHWNTPPHTKYPDSTFELFNGKTGDVRNFFNSEWVGLTGPAEFVVQLENYSRISWVRVHTAEQKNWGIATPSEIIISCSSDGVAWPQTHRQTVVGTPTRDGEYVFSNHSQIDPTWMCKYIKIRLENAPDKFSFISEVEIISPIFNRIQSAGVNDSYEPWAAWVKASQLRGDLKVRLYDQGVKWGNDRPITLSADKSSLTFRLPENIPPSKCNLNSPCSIRITIWDAANLYESTPFSLTLPTAH